MRGLAWYTAVVTSIAHVSLFIDVIEGVEVGSNVWGIALFVPITVFAIMYLKRK